jgi:hypothetical protein
MMERLEHGLGQSEADSHGTVVTYRQVTICRVDEWAPSTGAPVRLCPEKLQFIDVR